MFQKDDWFKVWIREILLTCQMLLFASLVAPIASMPTAAHVARAAWTGRHMHTYHTRSLTDKRLISLQTWEKRGTAWAPAAAIAGHEKGEEWVCMVKMRAGDVEQWLIDRSLFLPLLRFSIITWSSLLQVGNMRAMYNRTLIYFRVRSSYWSRTLIVCYYMLRKTFGN